MEFSSEVLRGNSIGPATGTGDGAAHSGERKRHRLSFTSAEEANEDLV
jgi:hypothetical protein